MGGHHQQVKGHDPPPPPPPVRPRLESCVQPGAPCTRHTQTYRRRCRDWSSHHQGKAGRAGTFPARRRLRGYLTNVCKHPMAGGEEDGARLSSAAPRTVPQAIQKSSFTHKKKAFLLRTAFFLRTGCPKSNFTPSLKISQTSLDLVLRPLLWLAQIWRGRLDQGSSRGPFQPRPFCGFMILPRNLSITGNSNTRQINMQQIHVRNHGTETDGRNKAVAEQLEPDVQSQPLSVQARKITECRAAKNPQRWLVTEDGTPRTAPPVSDPPAPGRAPGQRERRGPALLQERRGPAAGAACGPARLHGNSTCLSCCRGDSSFLNIVPTAFQHL